MLFGPSPRDRPPPTNEVSINQEEYEEMSHPTKTLALGLAASLAIGLPAFADHHMAAGHTSKTWSAGARLVVDGAYGPRTMQVVKLYQTAHELKVDGIAGPETLKSIGLPVGRTLRAGARGADVKALQKALNAHAHIWAKPAAKPTAKPASTAPMWTPAPTPMPTAEPTAEPTPAPWTPAPTVEPSAEPMEETTWRPTLQLYGGDWMLPKTSGQLDYDYTFTKPVWFGGGALWAGSWGIGGEYTTLPALYQGTTQVVSAAPMYDGQLKWRCDQGINEIGLGYRNFQGNHLGTVSYGIHAPLGTDVLKLRLAALGGSNFGPGWTADGRAGLTLGLGPIGIEGGYRVLGLAGFAGMTQTVWTHAPYATIGLQF
jgi:hypothetical protein